MEYPWLGQTTHSEDDPHNGMDLREDKDLPLSERSVSLTNAHVSPLKLGCFVHRFLSL